MAKLGLFALALGFLGIIAGATYTDEASAAKPCKRSRFDTKLVAEACQKGGQAEAKKVMKTFVKKAKKQDAKLECKSCHSKLAPGYDLKADGLQMYKDLGGK
jgi:hypothetical protein